MRRAMRISTSQTVTSLLMAFVFVVAFMLTGCTADSLTGPVLDSETTIQANDNHNNLDGNDNHNNSDSNDNHNNKNDNHNNKNDNHNN